MPTDASTELTRSTKQKESPFDGRCLHMEAYWSIREIRKRKFAQPDLHIVMNIILPFFFKRMHKY